MDDFILTVAVCSYRPNRPRSLDCGRAVSVAFRGRAERQNDSPCRTRRTITPACARAMNEVNAPSKPSPPKPRIRLRDDIVLYTGFNALHLIFRIRACTSLSILGQVRANDPRFSRRTRGLHNAISVHVVSRLCIRLDWVFDRNAAVRSKG